MSEAACKTILCGSAAIAAIKAFMIRHETDAPLQLKLAANSAEWEMETAIEVVHLLAEQGPKFKITREAAYELIAAMDRVELYFANQNDTSPTVPDSIAFLSEAAQEIHAGVLALHLAVTGEAADYSIH